MKKILFILCFLSLKAYSQEPTYLPMKSNYLYKGIKMDSLFILPNLDTTNARKVTGALVRQSNTFYWYNGVQWTPISSGIVSVDLQQVTDNGNTTTNDIQFTNDNDLLMDTFSSVLFSNNSRLQEGYIDAGYGGNHGVALVCGLGYEYKWEGGRLFVMNNSGNQIREAKYMFSDIPDNTRDYTKGYYVGSRWILDNGDTYICTDNSLNSAVWDLQPNAFDSTSLSNRIDLRVKYTDTASMLLPYLMDSDTLSLSNRINDKIDSIKRSTDSVYFNKNGVWYYAFKDSIGGANGFVPYTGATQDVDLGNNGLDAKFIKVTGTAGNGHIDLKHQSGDATGQANSTKLYANSSGYLKWKNDNLYYTTLATPQTANRVYTYQDKSYTLGDSADIELRVKYTDTASMLSPYLRKADTSTLSNRINLKLNISDTASMLTPYLRKVDTASLSNRINNLNLQDVTDVNDTTTNDIFVNSLYLNDLPNDGYGRISINDNLWSFKNSSNDYTMVKDYSGLFLYNVNGDYANIFIENLTKNREFDLPDTNGIFILDVDTASMLKNYQRTSAFPVATFGAGSGASGDTTAFTTSAIYGSFYNSGGDTIIVTAYTGVVQGTSASVTPTIYFNDSLNVTAGATKIVTSPSAVTSTTTGNTVTSLNNTKIPPGNFVWVKTETVTTKPTYFSLTLIGYRKR